MTHPAKSINWHWTPKNLTLALKFWSNDKESTCHVSSLYSYTAFYFHHLLNIVNKGKYAHNLKKKRNSFSFFPRLNIFIKNNLNLTTLTKLLLPKSHQSMFLISNTAMFVTLHGKFVPPPPIKKKANKHVMLPSHNVSVVSACQFS